MLRYLIEVVGTLLPPFLVLGALSGLVTRRKSLFTSRCLFYGGCLGFAVALAMVTIRLSTGRILREYYDLSVLFPGIAAELLLFALLAVGAGGTNGFGRRFLETALFVVSAAWSAYAWPDVFFYPFQFGVGMDSVINTECMFKAIGYLSGLFLCFLCFLATKRIHLRLPGRIAFSLFGLSLLVFFGKQSLSVLQILLARNLVPRNRYLTKYVIYMINRVDWYLFALMGVAAVAACVLFVINRRKKFSGDNPAQIRKETYAARVQKRWCAVLAAGVVFSLLTVTVGRSIENKVVELSPPQEVETRDGSIRIPLEKINDGRLHRFVHKTGDGAAIRYIIIKKSETAYGVGLDACDVCGPSGYYERGDQVVCILCDVVMNKSTIGFPGGCNPVPLAFAIDAGAMIIKTSDLEKEKRRFH